MPRDDGRGRGERSSRGRERDDDRDAPRGRSREPEARRGGGGFQYRGRSSEDVSRRAKQSSGRYDSYLTEDLVWFKPRDGENCIRLLPWLSASDPDFDALDAKWGNHWGIDIILHRNVGADKGTYLCLDKMKGEPCAVCDAWRDEDPDEKESLKPADRVLAWLIDRNDEKAGPKLWAMPLGTSKDFSAASTLKGTGEVLLVDDPEEGYDIFFDKEGEKKMTKYKTITIDRAPSPLHENEKTQARWLDFIADHRLPDLLKYYEPDYLEKILSGQLSARDRDDDDDGDRGGRARDRGRSRDRDDDRDARPSRSRGRDPEPDDDEDNDPSPRRSRREEAAEPEEEFDRPSRRPARSEPEDAPRASRGRGRAAEPEPEPDEAPPARSRRRERDPEPEPDDAPPARSRARGRTAEPDEQPEPEEDRPAPRRGGGVERRRSRSVVAEEDPDDDIPFDGKGGEDEVAAARDRLKDVGKRRGR